MTGQVRYAETEPGARLAPVSYDVTRLGLIRYCGASGDFNLIHWNERVARSVGLPGVVAHGMITMAQAGRYITDWAGPAAALLDFSVKFTSPVPVPDDDHGATIEVSGRIREKLDDNRVVLDLAAVSGSAKVLSRVRAVVRLP